METQGSQNGAGAPPFFTNGELADFEVAVALEMMRIVAHYKRAVASMVLQAKERPATSDEPEAVPEEAREGARKPKKRREAIHLATHEIRRSMA